MPFAHQTFGLDADSRRTLLKLVHDSTLIQFDQAETSVRYAKTSEIGREMTALAR